MNVFSCCFVFFSCSTECFQTILCLNSLSISPPPYCVTIEVVWISSLHDQSIFKPFFLLLPKVEYAVVVLNIVGSSDCLAGAVVLFLHPSWTAVHTAVASERWLLGKKPTIPLVTLYVPVLYFHVFLFFFFSGVKWMDSVQRGECRSPHAAVCVLFLWRRL